MKAFCFSIIVILFFLTVCTLDLTKVYAATESGFSQNCDIYGQTDIFTKEQIQETNGKFMRSSEKVN